MKGIIMKYFKHKTLPYVLITFVVLGLFTSGCSPVRRVESKVTEDIHSVKLKDAESVRAKITLNSGELIIDGGASDLMEANFTQNHNSLKPEVDYSVRGDTGELSVKQSNEGSIFTVGDIRREWDLRLNEDVPLEISIELGLGSSDLKLGDLDLEELDLDSGAGNALLDLVGNWDHDVDVNIEQGVGNLVLRLPKDFGVRVQIDEGIGSIKANGFKLSGNYYVNDAYSEASETLSVEIEQGAGSITLTLVE